MVSLEKWKRVVHVVFNFTCQGCGLKEDPKKPTLQVHHVIPLSEGGTNDLSNLTLFCARCHKKEHAKKPKKPKYYDTLFLDVNPDTILDDYERYYYIEQDSIYEQDRREVKEGLKRLC